MTFVDIIGFAAGALTTISFLPQIIKAWKTKHTSDISLGMFVILTTGIFLWLAYGILINSLPIIIANAVTLMLVATMLILKIIYK